MINFTLSEFNISGLSIPEKIADKILKFHIVPMQLVRDALNARGALELPADQKEVKVFPSQKSGFRPYVWEKARGRSGRSQHTFGQRKSGTINPKAKGAVDWTCTDFKKNKERMIDLIINKTQYTRIAIYGSFIHCDYKQTPSGERELYKSSPESRWTLVRVLD